MYDSLSGWGWQSQRSQESISFWQVSYKAATPYHDHSIQRTRNQIQEPEPWTRTKNYKEDLEPGTRTRNKNKEPEPGTRTKNQNQKQN